MAKWEAEKGKWSPSLSSIFILFSFHMNSNLLCLSSSSFDLQHIIITWPMPSRSFAFVWRWFLCFAKQQYERILIIHNACVQCAWSIPTLSSLPLLPRLPCPPRPPPLFSWTTWLSGRDFFSVEKLYTGMSLHCAQRVPIFFFFKFFFL